MTELNDQTQPRRPIVQTQPLPPEAQRPDTVAPGCWMWAILVVMAFGFSAVLVMGSGLWGWANGAQAIRTYGLQTQQAVIQEQLTTWIPRDVAEGNTLLLEQRLIGLASLTPPPSELAMVYATATQLSATLATVAVTATPTATATVAISPTVAFTPSPTVADVNAPLFDVAVLFTQAQTLYTNGEYAEAAKTLDSVMALDSTYQTEAVQALMLEALRAHALGLFRSGELAQGIIIADQALQYGDIGELGYERYVAGLYLDAVSLDQINPGGAIAKWAAIYSQNPTYQDVKNRLYQSYLNYADLLMIQLDYCMAEQQYIAASLLLYSPDAEAKRLVAQGACQSGVQATPISGTPSPDQPATTAPIGVPAPIGSPN